MLGFNGQIYKKLKNLEEQNNEKDKLQAMIAHDLRAPLNAISYVLDKSIEELKTNESLISLLQNGKSYKDLLMALINDLIDYGQIKQGVWKIRYSFFDLQEILEQIQGMFKMQTEAKGLDFQIINQVGHLDIFSDEQRIKQVLTNLISNSVKFTMKGFIKIKVKKSKSDNNNQNLLVLKIIDSGVGIQSGTTASLGEKAYETHNQQGLNSKGIGLGLFICKKIIQQLGPNESFKVKSEPNKKTQFSFEIYYKQEKEVALSFCKKFQEKGCIMRLNSAPVVSGALQFNKKKLKQSEYEEQKEQQQGMETINENLLDYNLLIQNNVNDEIDDIRKGLFAIKSQKSESQLEQQAESFMPAFNWANLNINTRRNRSLSAEVKLLNENESENEYQELKDFNNKQIMQTINQIISPGIPEDINEFHRLTQQQIQDIKIKPPLYFKEKNISSKQIIKKQYIVRQQSKHLSSINLNQVINNNSSSFQSPKAMLNILIADDDPFNLLILSQYLEKLKKEFRVDIKKAYHGGQAVEIFSELNEQIDIKNLNYIILDCQMPIMDGYNASQLIKEKIVKDNFVNAVVIGYTAEFGDEVEEKCKNANMDGYILKPATEKQFIEYLLSFLN